MSKKCYKYLYAEYMLCCFSSLRKFSLLVNNFLASLCWSDFVNPFLCRILTVSHNKYFSTFLLSVSLVFLSSPIQELLMFKLSGRTNSPSNPPRFVNFDLGSESHGDTVGFNPLHQFDHVGKKKLDQVCQAFIRLFWKQIIYLLFIFAVRNSFDILVGSLFMSSHCVGVLVKSGAESF